MDNKKKSIHDVITLLKENPEYGRAFYEHFEELRESLISARWRSVNPIYDKKCAAVESFVQEEILNQFGLKGLSRKD